MRIHSVEIKNFRSYREKIKVLFDDLTVFVGKNDIGKSTILEALDIFFNDGKGEVEIDKTDVNVKEAQNGNNETVISVCFSDLPSTIVIDSDVETTLVDEYMLNSDGLLEIVKKYKSGGKPSVYIRANHPTNIECNNLLQKKNTELKKIISDKKIACESLNINSTMRKAIWSFYSADLNLQNTEIDVSKEDAKKIWDKLAGYMPVYSLFQADRKNSDGDSEVQDPLKEAVKQIINDAELQKTLNSVAEIVEKKLKEVSTRTLEKLRDMDPKVASSLNPVIPSSDKLKWIDVFKSVSIFGDEDIPINKRGSGVKRLVLLSFFRAESERRSENGDNTGIIYAIEEPETSQHSNNQRILVRAFKTLANSKNTQVILTTHSPVIVKELDFRNIRLVCGDELGKKVVSIEPSVLTYPSLNEVNYVAYDEVTEEYHNELYGFLDYQEWMSDYKQGKKQYQYIREHRGEKSSKQIVLTDYIRHQIHHPENHFNEHFTKEQLRQSIEDMRNYICTRIEQENMKESMID